MAFHADLSAETVIPTAFAWPCQRQLPHPFPRPSSVAISPAAVLADLSLEAMIPTAISWLHPQRRDALPLPPAANRDDMPHGRSRRLVR